MKVRTNEEVASLDKSLTIFEEHNWDFLGVIEQQAVNYEYFDDIRDSSFDKSVKLSLHKLKVFIIVGISSIVLLLGTLILLTVTGVLGDNDYKRLKEVAIDNANTPISITTINGEEADNSDRIACLNTIADYVTVLNTRGDFNRLDEHCSTSSVLNSFYQSNASHIVSSYDINDCYARSIKTFSSFITLKSVDSVKINATDGIYYAYIQLNYPNASNMYEYVYKNKYNYTKHFQSSANLTKEEVIRYMLDNFEANSLVKSDNYQVVKLVKQPDGSFKIIDDSIFKDITVEAYEECINQIITVLKNTN